MYWQVQKRLALHCFTNATIARSSTSVRAFFRPQLPYAVCGKPRFPARRTRSTPLRIALKLGTWRWMLRTSLRMSVHFHCSFSRKYQACAEAVRDRLEGCKVTVSVGMAMVAPRVVSRRRGCALQTFEAQVAADNFVPNFFSLPDAARPRKKLELACRCH